ncbi:LPS export ABC transporter periplasmic protein LptC [Aestuariivirga sp.]|uniref:LPS export ABC transporter periplasmic protein LptC n=1 Tax=Aestuariivirga sp. TaxID=2650926 RepID=UPI00378413F6
MRTDSARRALRNASVARALSWLAALIGVAFICAFLVQAGVFQSLLPREETPPPDVDPNRITAEVSTVSGVDEQRQPYQVKAKRGWQDGASPNMVFLEMPEGRFRRAGGEEYTVTAAAGRYDTSAKTLELEGNVVLAQPDRFTARMEQANIAVRDKKLVSKSKVVVRFDDGGTVDANGMQITDDGARILFLNGVKARFAAGSGDGETDP